VSTPIEDDGVEPSTPPSALQQQLSQLDDAIRAGFARLRELERREDALRTEKAEIRTEIGILFRERLALTPRGRKTKYMKAIAEHLKIKKSAAYDNVFYAILHNDYGVDFPSLGKMSVQKVREEVRRLTGKAHEDTGRAAAEVVVNSVNFVVYDLVKFTQQEERRERLEFLRRSLEFLRRDDAQGIYAEWWADYIDRPSVVLSDEQLERGLDKWMVDSGAFSADNLNFEIPPPKYYKFLTNQRSWIGDQYFILDEINNDDPADAALVSWQRFETMRGPPWNLNPIPVFHPGEPEKYLRMYLDAGCQTIGLGGVARSGSRNPRSMKFFERCFDIVENCGRPVGVHALGIGVPTTLLAFPWASADSASWILTAQRYQRTDLSRLGSPAWQASLDYAERIAAASFLETHDAHLLEREIREQRPDFDYYLVIRLGNLWAWPALRLLQHRHVMISYWGGLGSAPDKFREFIENPDKVLSDQRYDRAKKLLAMMQDRYEYQRQCVQEILDSGKYRPFYTNASIKGFATD
jgi:hypothetical protein